MDVPGAFRELVRVVRDVGRPGMAAMAISALDTALWDLKSRLLDLPLVTLLGGARERVPIYGSGGFTSYSIRQLQEQLVDWVSHGIPRVKMKVGRQPERDIERVRSARDAIGRAELFVDANGAYARKQALAFAGEFRALEVVWFEDPVAADDLEGLRLLRDRAPSGMDIVAGKHGYGPAEHRRLLEAGAVDVLQADAGCCGGPTGFLHAAALCEAWALPLSAHGAPQLHAHLGGAAPRLRHIEYFHDHARVERLLFDGALQPIDGALVPQRGRPGLGIELKRADAAKYRVSGS
jgi:L-alanine-DL-glutamate epimerase-like enolase superfamily enzyme